MLMLLRSTLVISISVLMLSGCQTADLSKQTSQTIKMPNITVSLDSDGDGVPDDLDQCPGTPKGAKVDSVGCITLIDLNVNFDTNKSDIKNVYNTRIHEFAKKLGFKDMYEMADAIYDLKKERLDAASAYAKRVITELPDSEYSKSADDIYNKLEVEKEKFAKLQVEVEKRKAEYEAKTKNAQAEQNEKKEIAQEKNQRDMEKAAEQTRRDSAKINSPEPQATFKFKR